MGAPQVQMVTMMPFKREEAPPAGVPTLTKPAPEQFLKPSIAAKSSTLTIPIEGMSCASCVAKIEKGLSEIEMRPR